MDVKKILADKQKLIDNPEELITFLKLFSDENTISGMTGMVIRLNELKREGALAKYNNNEMSKNLRKYFKASHYYKLKKDTLESEKDLISLLRSILKSFDHTVIRLSRMNKLTSKKEIVYIVSEVKDKN